MRPASAGTQKLPAALVIHEPRAQPAHRGHRAQAGTRWLHGAGAGRAHAAGRLPGNEDKAREAFAKLDQAKTREDMLAGAAWLHARADGNGKMGAVGFCWGGGMVHHLATKLPDLNAAVAFYGPAPAPEDATKVKAPLLVQLADKDDFVNPSWTRYEPALKAAGAKYEVYQYPGTQHGFNNDTTPRYDAAAAKQAWDRTVSFFKSNLA